MTLHNFSASDCSTFKSHCQTNRLNLMLSVIDD